MNQRNEELKYKTVGSRFSCKARGMERFSQDFLRAVRRENVLCKRLWVWLEFVVTDWSKVTFFFTLYIKVGGGGGWAGL